MRILVANDDGIHAQGLALLEAIARRIGDEVWVVAPDGERSWQSRAHTSYAPIRAVEVGERRWAISGTPADCVMLGLRTLMGEARPDLVLSGINHGSNLGEEVGYSGTLGAAMEGTVAGIRSIGISQLYDPATRAISWAPAEAHVEPLLRRLLQLDWSPEVMLSINLPPAADPAEIAGVRFTHLARRNVADGLYYGERRLDLHGRAYYWAGFKPNMMSDDPESDVGACARNYISVCPIHLDMTHKPTLQSLAGGGFQS